MLVYLFSAIVEESWLLYHQLFATLASSIWQHSNYIINYPSHTHTHTTHYTHTHTHTHKAIVCFEHARDVQDEWPQAHHLFSWELMWCHWYAPSHHTTNNTHPLLLLLLLASEGNGSPLLLLLMISTGIPSGLRYAVLYDFILNLPKFQESHWVCDSAAVHPLSFFPVHVAVRLPFYIRRPAFSLWCEGPVVCFRLRSLQASPKRRWRT